jgi:hypothetical protein
MPPWYQLVPIRFEPTNKLPQQKLQYPTYLKDTNPNTHIRIFKKTIRVVEADIINMFSFIL